MLKKMNIVDHVLVPKHEILSPREAAKILKKLGIKPHQLPWIKASDPVIVAINAKPGDIVRIIRKSPTAGETIIYRYVIPG